MSAAQPSYGKPDTGFRRLGTSLEPEGGDLGYEQTNIDRFFVCSVAAAPEPDVESWRLRIDGDAAARSVQVSLDDLKELEQVTVVACLECAGNCRRLFDLVAGHDLSDDLVNTQWLLGAVGLAVWTGPRLSSVLALAEPLPGAAFIGPVGLDRDNAEGEPVRMSLPIDKANHADTIVALTMNGAPLASAHGAPARLLVPGWVGAYSVKWLDRIELSRSWIDSWRANEYYVLRDETGRVTGPATAHPVKSQLRLDWNAQLAVGPAEIMGYARSGVAPIVAVEWVLDDGPWQPVELLDDFGPWAWRPFLLRVDLAPGRHRIRTRAGDASGAQQPEVQPVHRDGVLWNAIIPHPVTVVA